MRVNLFSTFREAAGTKTITVQDSSLSTVRQLIEYLITNYPDLKPVWMNENGDLYVHVHVCVNQEDIDTLPNGLDTSITDVDIIDIFPPVTGG